MLWGCPFLFRGLEVSWSSVKKPIERGREADGSVSLRRATLSNAEHRGVAATDQAAARRFGCFQFHGSNSASRPCGMSAIWPSTSASQACGSTSLSLAVYADCRTMPNGFGKNPSFARTCGWSSGRRPSSIRHSLASYSASRKASRRSLGWKRVRLRCSYGLSFARAASLSARWACR